MSQENCDRARRWVSVALDEGLSDLERRLLATHLERCDECRTFERRVRTMTHELRRAELVPLARPIELPARRRRLVGMRVASASAAAAALMVFGAVSLSTSSDSVRPDFLVKTSNMPNTEVADLREARRAELVARSPSPQFTHVQMARGDRI